MSLYIYDIDGHRYRVPHDTSYPVFRKEKDPMDDFIELEIASRLLLHPQENVVKIYDVVKTQDECYIDMEYLCMDKGHPKVEDWVKGIDQLHSLGIVYIDVKEDNIGYSTIDNCFKIIDFDLSGIVYPDKTNKWSHEPIQGYMYQDIMKCKNTFETLFDMDTYALELAYSQKKVT